MSADAASDAATAPGPADPNINQHPPPPLRETAHRVDTGRRYNWETEEWGRGTVPPPCREVIETAGEGNDAEGAREEGWRRWRTLPPHTYEQLLMGWFMDAEGTRTTTTRQRRHPPPQRLRWGRGPGDKPSTRHPPLRALARRVDWVLMAMSTTPRMPPTPTTPSRLPTKWRFCFS
jgi:hypothetical protein